MAAVPTLRVVLVAIAIFALAAACTSAAETASTPITVSASTVGYFSKGHSWRLAVDTTGQATLLIDSLPPQHRQFQVSPEQLDALRRSVAIERFFELNGEYGEMVADGSTTTITITDGSRSKSVRLRFLMNWVHYDRRRLREPSRAVRVFQVVRSWFNDAEAVDLRRYDQMIIDAVSNEAGLRF